jgi:hypothetical protein
MASFSEIVELNRRLEVSETDPFTERGCEQFVRHPPPDAHNVRDVGCNTSRGGVVMKRFGGPAPVQECGNVQS